MCVCVCVCVLLEEERGASFFFKVFHVSFKQALTCLKPLYSLFFFLDGFMLAHLPLYAQVFHVSLNRHVSP